MFHELGRRDRVDAADMIGPASVDMEQPSILRGPVLRRQAPLGAVTHLWLGVVVLLLSASLTHGKYANGPKIPPQVLAKLKTYKSPYYTVYSDLEPEKVELAIARLTSVAEEYHERTRGFGGKITQRLPFFLITSAEDYRAAGGEAAGCTWADRLMAHPTKATEKELWHVIQHEAFHQFAHTVISEDLPGWVDEGMAEYFGESLWTGDGLVCGIIPPHRYKRLLSRVRENRIKPFKEIIMIPATKWSGIDDYDEAWSMIHFMVHAENGKHVKELSSYIKSTAGGAPWDQAFAKTFGRNIDALQKEYLAWWAAQPETAGDRAYTQAVVQTLGSYLARAHTQGQNFQDANEFLKAAHDGTLKKHPKQPLSDELLSETMAQAEKLKEWSLETPEKGLPKLILTQPDGTAFTATFTLKAGLVEKVKVAVKEGKSAGPAEKDAEK
jgi:hypothetical protein